MSIEVISFILLRIMPVIFIIGFVFYLVNAFRYREIAFRYLLNADWMPYVYKAEICLAGVFSLIFVDLLEIKNFIILTVILGLTIILLIWIIFTDIFHKQEEKNRLYRELIYVWNQEDLTDFQKLLCMTKLRNRTNKYNLYTDYQFDRYGRQMGNRDIWSRSKSIRIPDKEDYSRVHKNEIVGHIYSKINQLNIQNLYDTNISTLEILDDCLGLIGESKEPEYIKSNEEYER